MSELDRNQSVRRLVGSSIGQCACLLDVWFSGCCPFIQLSAISLVLLACLLGRFRVCLFVFAFVVVRLIVCLCFCLFV